MRENLGQELSALKKLIWKLAFSREGYTSNNNLQFPGKNTPKG